MPSLTVSRTAEPPEDWRAFAVAHGTFYHRPEWPVCLAEMYRLRVEYYSARAGGELRGLLALAEIPPLLGPRRYVSLPFSYAAGPLAQDDTTAAALSQAAMERALARRIGRVEATRFGRLRAWCARRVRLRHL